MEIRFFSADWPWVKPYRIKVGVGTCFSLWEKLSGPTLNRKLAQASYRFPGLRLRSRQQLYEELPWVFGLLCLFQVKHYVADFPLQVPYMLQKTKPGWDFFVPLAVHCSVHTILSLSIILAVNPAYWWLALFDGASHFVMDRIKSGPRYLGRYNNPQTSEFWSALGFDQMIHHLTNFYMVFVLVTDQFNPFSSL